MGQMFGQAQRQRPDRLQQMLGSGGALSNPLAKMAMAGTVCMLRWIGERADSGTVCALTLALAMSRAPQQ